MSREDRRWALKALGGAMVLPLAGPALLVEKEAEVTPGEDLMQEHGLIERLLLVYSETARRIEAGDTVDLWVLEKAARMFQRFVEGYHEQLEEQLVFPRLEKAGREAQLVATLRRQHAGGRDVTARVLRQTGQRRAPPELATLLRSFERMYRPHAAREDTVLFPAFREVIGPAAYRELGEQFEDREHKTLGREGFEGQVKEIAKLEEALGIGDLATFTVA
jgi:hemerythrin-like domain-containing protein